MANVHVSSKGVLLTVAKLLITLHSRPQPAEVIILDRRSWPSVVIPGVTHILHSFERRYSGNVLCHVGSGVGVQPLRAAPVLFSQPNGFAEVLLHAQSRFGLLDSTLTGLVVQA